MTTFNPSPGPLSDSHNEQVPPDLPKKKDSLSENRLNNVVHTSLSKPEFPMSPESSSIVKKIVKEDEAPAISEDVPQAEQKMSEAAELETSKPLYPPKTKGKVSYLALKLWGMFSEKGKVEYENYVHSHLDYRSAVSERQTNHINAQPLYHPSLNHAGSYLSIDPEARVSASQLERPFTEHEFAARSAKNKDHFYAEVKDVDIEGVGVLTGYGFDDLGQPQPGYVVPTSYWIGGAETKDQNHLMNVYVIRPDGEPAVIRSSKIDSKEKADEFVNLLILIRDQIRVETGNPDYQLRVTSEQLNSFDLERETSMIKDQHRWLAYANQKMEREGVGELLHLNLPANTFYFISSKLRKSGVAGKVFEKNVFNGEIRSKNQNLDGWGTYLRWVNQDLQVALQDKSLEGLTNPNNESATNFIEGYLEKQKPLSAAIVHNQNLVRDEVIKIDQLKAEVKAIKNLLKQGLKEGNLSYIHTLRDLWDVYAELRIAKDNQRKYRKELKVNFQKQYKQLVVLQDQLNSIEAGSNAKFSSIKKGLFLMQQVLGSQLDIPGKKATRIRELLMVQELNEILGVTSAGNCKGGVDRTPVWHSLVLTLKQMKKVEGFDTFRMAEEWDQTTREMNKEIHKVGPEKFMEWLNSPIVGSDQEALKKETYREVIEFRKMMLVNLMRVGLPITERSTGLQGFKWAPGGYKENRMPLNLLPSHVQIDGEIVSLIRYGERGQVLGLTEEGSRVLTKFQGMRGS